MYPAAVMTIVTAIPKNRESIVAGNINFPISVNTGPAIMEAIAYFGGIDKCRFRGKIVPGDKVRLETKIIKTKGPVGIGEAIASVDGKTVVRAELTFMIG